MCAGSVHAFHTSSRGASKRRVAAISRSPTSAVLLLSAAMPAFDEILQRSAHELRPAFHEVFCCERGKLREGFEALVRKPDPRLAPFGEQLEGHERVARVAFVAPRVGKP